MNRFKPVLLAVAISLFLAIPSVSLGAWALAETQKNFNDGVNHTTLAAPALNVSSGDLIVVTLSWGEGGTSANLTVTCTNCGSDTFAQSTKVDNTGDGYQLAVFYKCNATANASYTVQGNNDQSQTFSRIVVERFTGGFAGSCFDKTTGQRETAPGTGTDAVDSGATASTTTNGELVHGAVARVGAGAMTKGTGFTDGTTAYASTINTEYMTQSSAGAATATFTTASNGVAYTIVTTFKPVVVSRRPIAPTVME